MICEPVHCPECRREPLTPTGYQFKLGEYLKGTFECPDGHEITLSITQSGFQTFVDGDIKQLEFPSEYTEQMALR